MCGVLMYMGVWFMYVQVPCASEHLGAMPFGVSRTYENLSEEVERFEQSSLDRCRVCVD